MKLGFMLLIIIIALIEYIGDASLKSYARSGGTQMLLVGVGAYMATVVVLIYILKSVNVMYMNLNWDAVSVVIETILAYVLLKETLSNNYQWAGFILIIIGLLLLNVGKPPK